MPRYSDILDRYNRAEWRWGLTLGALLGFVAGALAGAVGLAIYLVLKGQCS